MNCLRAAMYKCNTHTHTAIDFQFDQQEYLVKEDQGTVRVCLEIATDGFLPRPIVMSLVTMDGNATGNAVEGRVYT